MICCWNGRFDIYDVVQLLLDNRIIIILRNADKKMATLNLTIPEIDLMGILLHITRQMYVVG